MGNRNARSGQERVAYGHDRKTGEITLRAGKLEVRIT